MMFHTFDLLIILMAFSDNGDHVTLLGVPDRVKDCFPSVRDHKICSVRLRKAHLDVLDDVLVFLKTRIVRRDDAEIRHLSTDLPH